MESIASQKPDLVVEVAHPEAVRRYGTMVLRECDLMKLSVSALVDAALEKSLRKVRSQKKHTTLHSSRGGVGYLTLWQDLV
jgi:predicted dinucleotide-utilizing enzyme